MNKRKTEQMLYAEVGYPLIDHTRHVTERGSIISFAYPFGLKDVTTLVQFCSKNNLDATFQGGEQYGHGTVKITIRDIFNG